MIVSNVVNKSFFAHQSDIGPVIAVTKDVISSGIPIYKDSAKWGGVFFSIKYLNHSLSTDNCNKAVFQLNLGFSLFLWKLIKNSINVHGAPKKWCNFYISCYTKKRWPPDFKKSRIKLPCLISSLSLSPPAASAALAAALAA